jgi:hypothetical protein
MSKNFQLRVTQEWEDQLDSTLRNRPLSFEPAFALKPLRQEPVSRASYVRETIEMENLLWRRSPYVAESSTFYVLVNRTGDFAVLRQEELLLNSDLRGIPAHAEIRHEKRQILAGRDPWRLCAFSLEYGEVSKLELDPQGSGSKSHWFKGPFLEGTRLRREGLFFLENYLSFADPEDSALDLEALYDHVDIEIDIPTRRLEILVVADLDLFEDDHSARPPALRFDIRNRDGVPFSSPDAVDHFLRQRSLVRIGSRYPAPEPNDELYKSLVQAVGHWSSELDHRLEVFAAGRPNDERLEDIRRRSHLPDCYLLYGVSWTGAHIGLTCAVKIPKPRSSGTRTD